MAYHVTESSPSVTISLLRVGGLIADIAGSVGKYRKIVVLV